MSFTENGTNIVKEDIPYTWKVSDNGNFIEISIIGESTQPCNNIKVVNLSDETLTLPVSVCYESPEPIFDAVILPYFDGVIGGLSYIGDYSELPITVEFLTGYFDGALYNVINLKEGSIYTIKLHTETDIIYKDLVYVTSQTDKKKVHSIVDGYTTVTRPDDEYIIL